MPELDVHRVPYTHPDAVALTAAAQEFYVSVYGGPDQTPFTAAEFAPPHGAFCVGYVEGRAVAMGGWRFRAPLGHARRPAEIKRMFVDPAHRRRGLARRLLTALEEDAAAAGADWLVLETGLPQVAAVAFYAAAGYREVEPFGHYRDEPDVLNLGKPLPVPSGRAGRTGRRH